MDNVERSTIAGVVAVFIGAVALEPSLAENTTFVVVGGIVTSVGIVGKVVKDYFGGRR